MDEKKLTMTKHVGIDDITRCLNSAPASRLVVSGDIGSGKSVIADLTETPVLYVDLTAEVIDTCLDGSTLLWIFRTRELSDGAANALSDVLGLQITDRSFKNLDTGECYTFLMPPATSTV